MFGFHRRLVRRCECETCLPKPGPLPQTSHTAATVTTPPGSLGNSGTESPTGTHARLPPGDQPRITGRHCRLVFGAIRSCSVKRVADDPQRPAAGAPPATTRNVDVHVVRDWAGVCVRSLYRLRGEIDDINVYPVADSDTGSNLLATIDGGNHALTTESSGTQTRSSDDGAGRVLAVFAGGAVRAARGNSGVILAQARRGLADAASGLPELDGDTFARALDNAALAATATVANPVEGTMLSVLRAAAEGAHEVDSTRASVVVTGAAAAAARAVEATPGQLRT